FYRNEFSKVKEVCTTSPEVPKIINYLKQKGLKLALATTLYFPKLQLKAVSVGQALIKTILKLLLHTKTVFIPSLTQSTFCPLPIN
ncbi:MAG: hypothetical protein U0L88_06940, partial [Acutalibacteraceae bacterium]|nr:hypothetical protein [Acutalibacteraceae bacterium]